MKEYMISFSPFSIDVLPCPASILSLMKDFSEQRIEVPEEHVHDGELARYIMSIPALFWRIHLVKKSIEFLNDYELPELGKDSRLLLQNKEFARKVVLNEDAQKLSHFLRSFHKNKRIQTIIRVHPEGGTIRWLKLTGLPAPHDFTYFHGYIMDITDAVDDILFMDARWGGISNRIELFDTPVLLLEMTGRNLYAANTAARNLFGISDASEKSLRDLFVEMDESRLYRIFEHLIFHESWDGELQYRRSDSRTLRAMTTMRPLVADGYQLIWIALHDTPNIHTGEERECGGLSGEEEALLKEEIRRKAEEGSMSGMLEALIRYQPQDQITDSILYSHISSSRDIVIVWGEGEPFQNLSDGARFPYEGTIAENIDSFQLPYLIVENTLESIKPIDWALFIPSGVKSYFAVPFYEENILKTVLIFCSQNVHAFRESHYQLYTRLYESFSEYLPLWRERKTAEIQFP